MIDNLEMTLAKSSLEIARGYLELVPEGAERDRIWALIAGEHARTVAAVLAIVDEPALLDRHPALQRSVRLRNPYVDPMNAIQVDLLARYRAAGSDDERAPPGRAARALDRRHRRGAAQHGLDTASGPTARSSCALFMLRAALDVLVLRLGVELVARAALRTPRARAAAAALTRRQRILRRGLRAPSSTRRDARAPC